MPNPDICDKCWAEYYGETAPLDERSCKDIEEWFCPEDNHCHKARNKYALPPKDCLKLFEQSVAMGLEHAKS